MKQYRSLLVTTLLTLSSIAASAHATEAKSTVDHFGSAFSNAPAKSLAEVMKQPETFKTTPVLVEADVKQICEKKGCWMSIENGNTKLRVVFKDYSFFVPKRLIGQKVKIEGVVEAKELSVKEQQHMLKDAGADAKEIAAVTSPKKEFQFVASAVERLGESR